MKNTNYEIGYFIKNVIRYITQYYMNKQNAIISYIMEYIDRLNNDDNNPND